MKLQDTVQSGGWFDSVQRSIESDVRTCVTAMGYTNFRTNHLEPAVLSVAAMHNRPVFWFVLVTIRVKTAV